LLAPLLRGISLSGEVSHDVPVFLAAHGHPRTAVHCEKVAREAARIARSLGAAGRRAEIAGWLHDVSAVFPPEERLETARALGVEILPEEAAFPLLLHQKLSAILAREIFGVEDAGVLSAIRCHTTLRPGATRLDKIVFVADKLAWDQPGVPPYATQMRVELARSLDAGTFVYLDYLWERRASLKAVHPWFVAAYEERLKVEDQELKVAS
jgi:predicted HD superfamily hydrolase involved in NAD metabolism